MIKIEKEVLENKIFNENLPYEQIGKLYGCSGGYIRKYAKSIGIDLPKRREISDNETFNKGKTKGSSTCASCGKEIPLKQKFCSLTCQQNFYRNLYIERWKQGKENGLSGEYGISSRIRHYLMDKYSYKCQKCGWGEVNPFTGKIPLEVHHKDGSYQNNQEENLELLCPNCHSLTETSKSHNKNGRKGRKKYYQKVNKNKETE